MRSLTLSSATTVAILLLLNLFGLDCLKLEARIIGGLNAAVNTAPFMVSLRRRSPILGNFHYCGGTILNGNWIVTSADCLSIASINDTFVIAGSNCVNGNSNSAQIRSISYYVVNDLYAGVAGPNNIGLVYVATAFTWTSAVQPASLPELDAIPTGTASFFGWGSLSSLQVTVSLTILNEVTCESFLGSELSFNLFNTTLCTGPLTGGVGLCTGDSGGPLMQGNTLIGIAEWHSPPCLQKNSPDVFVRVSAFVSWINDNQIVPGSK